MSAMNEYKTIKIASLPFGKHESDLRAFFHQYPKDDIHFEIDKNNLVISLRQLDFPTFKNNVELVRSNNGLNKILNAIAQNIERKIC